MPEKPTFGKRGEAPSESPKPRSRLAFRTIGDDDLNGLIDQLFELRGEITHGVGAMDVSPEDRAQVRELRRQISERLQELGHPALREGELE